MSSKKDEEKQEAPWPLTAFLQLCLLALVVWIFPWCIEPFTVLSPWSPPVGVETWAPALWAQEAWPVVAWGTGVSFVCLMLGKGVNRELVDNAEGVYLTGFGISAWAGIAEEIAFRWIFFLYGMIGIKVGNFIFLGFIPGWGIPENIYGYIVGPIANFFTFGLMENWLFHPTHWAIGAAILAANAKFRDGHKYQGPFGIINSWYIGMFFFWIMFTYGLLAAIVVHFVYDFLIFTMLYVVSVSHRIAR